MSTNFKTKIRLSDNKVYQNSDDILTLSGDTTIKGKIIIDQEQGGELVLEGTLVSEGEFVKVGTEGILESEAITQGHILKNIPDFVSGDPSEVRDEMMGDNGIVFKNINNKNYTTLGFNDKKELKSITKGVEVTVSSVPYTKDTYVYEYKDYGTDPNKLKKEVRIYYNTNGVMVRMEYKDQLKDDMNLIVSEVYDYDDDGELKTNGSGVITTGITYKYDNANWFDE